MHEKGAPDVAKTEIQNFLLRFAAGAATAVRIAHNNLIHGGS